MPGAGKNSDKKASSKIPINEDVTTKKTTADSKEEVKKDNDELDLRSLMLKLNADTQQSITQSEDNIKTYIDEKYRALKGFVDQNVAEINKVRGTTLQNKLDVSVLKKEMESLAERVHTVEEDNTKLVGDLQQAQKTMDIHAIQNHILQTRLEDQTNRNCRRTLIVKGIPESAKENWDQTKKILIQNLVEICKLKADEFARSIERVHRGKLKKDDPKAGARDIHVLFFDWNIAQLILSQFIEHGRGKNIFIEQRYGPDTTFRRNKAKEERRELLTQKVITGGYVQFPAKLMVKYSKDDAKYSMHKDFSKLDVKSHERYLQS